MEKRRILQVVITLWIIAAVIGIWYFKNMFEDSSVTDSDFALYATDDFDLEKLKAYGLPILIQFGADYCPTCRYMEPILEKVNKDLWGKAIIKHVDIEEHTQLAQKFPIRVIPTQVFFDKTGKPFVPANPEDLGMLMYYSRESQEHVLTVHEGYMSEEMILTVLKEMGLEK